ncbi:MAG: sigma-E factor regulatory protein RseB domain-containing protein [Elusimicrobiota bacterium]
MCIKALLAACCLALAPRAYAASAADVLADSLAPSAVAFSGQLSIVTRHDGREKEKLLTVAYAPPNRYKREVVDRHGFPLLTIVSDGEEEWIYDRQRATAWRGEPADPDYKLLDPDEEQRLLELNYTFSLRADETVAGRVCRVLEVRARSGGRLVRQLWVDREYGIVLQRAAYLADGSEASRMSFHRLEVPAEPDDWEFTFTPPAGVRTERSRIRPDYLEFDEAAAATDMRPQIPAWLPPGYLFESVNILPHKGATILHYRFTDGLDVLSLFQAPRRARVRYTGALAAAGAAPGKVAVGGAGARLVLTADGKFLEWWGEDHFVLLGRLGVDALRRVAESLMPAGEARP